MRPSSVRLHGLVYRNRRRDGRGSDEVKHWSEREIDESAFKDARLGRRFSELLRQIGNGMGGSIPFACQDWASTKAAYRFFANERVEEGVFVVRQFETDQAFREERLWVIRVRV